MAALIAEQLADFAFGLTDGAIPSAVRRRAAHLMLDGAGIALASTTFDFARQTVAAMSTFEPGHCPVIGIAQTLALRDAVLANGILVHGLDFDDTHLVGVVHATASCFPTALGAAWAGHRSGRDLLTAYVIGMETAARLGTVAKGEMNQIGFHPTGVIAAFACALVAGKLAGLTCEQLVMAQGIALSMAAGTREYSSNGASTKRMHPGWAGVCGITAARLAASGFTGPRSTYEGKFGLFATHLGADTSKWDLAAAAHALGSEWQTTQVAIKPFPACQLGLSCIDAAIKLAREHGVKSADVAHIEALIPPHAVSIVCEPVAERKRPTSSYAAQFSIQYAVACALIHKNFGLTELERYRDPEILALAQKVDYRVDPDTGYPKHFSGEVIVTLTNGQRIAHREQVNLGAADNPVSDDGIVAKFMGNAQLAVSAAHAATLRDMILNIDAVTDARNLAEALAGAHAK
jgi:2-methylcitrate dehydratase PrpD